MVVPARGGKRARGLEGRAVGLEKPRPLPEGVGGKRGLRCPLSTNWPVGLSAPQHGTLLQAEQPPAGMGAEGMAGPCGWGVPASAESF